MKNYEEMAKSVLSRRDAYVAERKKHMKKLVSIGSCFCLILLVGVGIWHTQNSTFVNVPSQAGKDNDGGGIPTNFTTQNNNSEQAVLLFAQQNIIAELQKDISERDLQGWVEEDSILSINYEYVLPVYAPNHIAADSTNLSDTLVFIDQYKAPAISNGVCIGTFTLVQHENKWTIFSLEVGLDLEAAIMQHKDNATCFLSIAQFGTEYGFLAVSNTDETYASITHNCHGAKTGTDLLKQLKAKVPSSSIDDTDG